MLDKIEMPRFIEIETSRLCNRRCIWCPNGSHEFRTEQEIMKWEMFTSLLDELARLNYSGWLALHNYNEPLLNPRLIKELETIRDKVPLCHPCIFTNGDYLTVPLFEQLCNVGVVYVRVVIYPPSHKCEEYVQPSNKRIERWLDIKSFNHLKWRFADVRQGLAAITNSHRTRMEVISPDLRTYNYRGNTAVVLVDAIRTTPCYLTTHSASIDYQGQLKMCCNVFPENPNHASYVIGVIGESSFSALWTSTRLQMLRDAHRSADWAESSICAKCTHQLHERQIYEVGGSPG